MTMALRCCLNSPTVLFFPKFSYSLHPKAAICSIWHFLNFGTIRYYSQDKQTCCDETKIRSNLISYRIKLTTVVSMFHDLSVHPK